MVTDLCCHLNNASRGRGIQCMPCSSRIISEMLSEILTMEKGFEPIIHAQKSNSLFIIEVLQYWTVPKLTHKT